MPETGSEGYPWDLLTNLKGWVGKSWGSLWPHGCVRNFGILVDAANGSSETLKDFKACFNFENMTMEDPTNDMIFMTLYQGLSPEGPLVRKLARK